MLYALTVLAGVVQVDAIDFETVCPAVTVTLLVATFNSSWY